MAHLETLTGRLRALAPFLEPPVERGDIEWTRDLPALDELLASLAAVLDRDDYETFTLDKEERDVSVRPSFYGARGELMRPLHSLCSAGIARTSSN